MLSTALPALLACAVVGGCCYYLIVIAAVRAFLSKRARAACIPAGAPPSCSLLKPLAGDEPELEENLRSFFNLRYPNYEVLFAARKETDAALSVANRLASCYTDVRSRTLVAGEPVCANAKVHSLAAMTEASAGEILVISDSDVRVDSAFLDSLRRDFADSNVGVVTYPYRATTDGSVWSRLEALGMNTEFWGGVLAAQFLAPMDFAVGPTMAVRRECLERVGGWAALGDYLAEDFQLGRWARRAGYDVRLGTHVVEHRIGCQDLASNLRHRLRWRRSTRRSRPIGYWGEIFANPLPWAALLPVAASWAAWGWALFATCATLRFATALAVGLAVLRDRSLPSRIWLLPFQDALSLLTWVAGFFGNQVVWRDRRYELMPDGRLRHLSGSGHAASSA